MTTGKKIHSNTLHNVCAIYTGDVQYPRGIISALEGVQYTGGYHEYTRGMIMISVEEVTCLLLTRFDLTKITHYWEQVGRFLSSFSNL